MKQHLKLIFTTLLLFLSQKNNAQSIIANDDNYTCEVGQFVILDILSNDIADSTVTLTLIYPPNYGLAVNNNDSTFTYYNLSGAVGSIDTLEYLICIGSSPPSCDVALVTIEIVPLVINNAPIGSDIYINDFCTYGMNMSISLQNMFTDIDGDTLTYSALSMDTALNYTIYYTWDNVPYINYSYESAPNAMDTIGIIACDALLCDTAYIILQQGGLPDSIYIYDTLVVNTPYYNVYAIINYFVNFYSWNEDMPMHGSLVLSSTAISMSTSYNLTYTPFWNFTGTDTFDIHSWSSSSLLDPLYYPTTCNEELIYIITYIEDTTVINSNIDTSVSLCAYGNTSINLEQYAPVAIAYTILDTGLYGTNTIVYFGDYYLIYTPNTNNMYDTVSVLACNDMICDTLYFAFYNYLDIQDTIYVTLDAGSSYSDIHPSISATGVTINQNPQLGDATISLTIENYTLTYSAYNTSYGSDTVLITTLDYMDTAPFTHSCIENILYIFSINDIANEIIIIDSISCMSSAYYSVDTSAAIYNNPMYGSAILSEGSLHYIPDPSYTGWDTLRVLCAFNNASFCDTSVYYIYIDCPPYIIAYNDTFYISIDSVLVYNPGINDVSYPYSSGYIYTITTAPMHGFSMVTGTNNLVYVPNTGYSGIDSLQLITCATGYLCDTSWTYIFIADNFAPIAENVYLTICPFSFSTIILNDYTHDIDDSTLTYTIIDSANHADIYMTTISSELTIENIAGATSPDTIIIQVCDMEGLCDTMMIYIDASLIYNDTVYITTMNGYSYSWVSGDEESTNVTTAASHGIATISVNDTMPWVYTFNYIPENDFIGTDTVVLTTEDIWSPGCINILYIFNVIDSVLVNMPPVANIDYFAGLQDSSLTLMPLQNDVDENIEALDIEIISYPIHGEAVIYSNGNIVYQPDSGYVGMDSMQYIICDIEGLCDTSWIYLNIININSVYIDANTDSATAMVDQTIIVNVLSNDSLFGGVDVIIIENGINGTATVNENNTITYTPNTGYVGIDQLTYIICDTIFNICDTAIVYFTILDDTIEPTDCIYTQAITPNGDGINENFIFCDKSTYPTARLIIYNRWGSLVYEKNSYNNEWHGQYFETEYLLPDGCYYYLIETNPAFITKDNVIKGYIYIIR